MNGGESVTVAGKLEGGKLEQTVEVVSKGDWTLTFKNSGDSQWVTPSAMSGKTGTTQLTFTLGQASAERSAILVLTASSTFEGFPLTDEATITVVQNEGGSTDVETNVKEIRTKMAAIAADPGVTISEDLTLTGIVVSDVEAGGFAGNRNCVVVDNSTEAGAGIIVRFPASGYKFPVGQVITGSIKGAKAALSYGVLQIDLDGSSVSFSAVEGYTVDVQPIVVPAADLATYESQYVKVNDVQPIASARGGKFYQGTSSYTTTKFETKTGGSLDISIYKTNDWAKTAEVPAKSGYVCGLVSIYNGVGQVAPRNAKDVAGLTNDLFTEAGPVTSTIAGITEAGKYKVENAIVAANYESGFVMEDATGQMLVYQFIKGATITIPAVGAKVTVTGTVESKNGMLQFSPEGLTVAANGTGTVKPQTATVLDGAAVTALFNSPVMKYVKYTGKLTVDGNYYNVALDGTEVIGSISYPNADLNVASFNGQTIDVEGWFIGATTAKDGSKYLTTLAVKVSANASVPSVTFTDQPTQFAATSPAEQTLKYTANAAAGAVTFEITGTDATKFAVVSNTTSQVVIKAVGNNTGTIAFSATLKAKGANGGEDTVELKQAAPVSGDGGTVEIDFSAKGYANGVDVTTVTESPLTLTFAKSTGNNPPKYYTSGTAVRMYAANTLTITGATITNVEYTMVDGYNNLIVTDGTYTGTTWTGSSSNLVFTSNPEQVGGKYVQTRIQKMTITYKNSRGNRLVKPTTLGGDNSPSRVWFLNGSADQMLYFILNDVEN